LIMSGVAVRGPEPPYAARCAKYVPKFSRIAGSLAGAWQPGRCENPALGFVLLARDALA
jgi:hypothetical protein